jgi:hypothetical protein
MWAEGGTPRLLTSESEAHTARDAGELEEHPGNPDTDGQVFTVNCPHRCWPHPASTPVTGSMVATPGRGC